MFVKFENKQYSIMQQEAATVNIHHTPSVAVVILNWNGQSFMEKFLPALLSSSYPNKKIIVADNASTDNSVEWLQQQYPQVEIILNKTNEGFAKGYNSAFKKIQSDYYVLLNSDVEVTTRWIEPVIELMETDAAIAACQPKVLTYSNKNLFEYAGASGGWMDNLGYPFSRGRVFDEVEQDKGQYDDAAPCFWASGAALFVKADKYHETGGLDEYFFAHQEEIDFCWRLQLAGYKVYVQPKSVVYHVGGGTLPKGNKRKVYLNFRNNMIMLYKNLPFDSAVWKIPFRVGLDAVAAWKELFAGNASYFFAVAKAHLDAAGWFLFHKSRSVFPISRKGALQGWFHGSVVWQYFIKKKKNFSEIIDTE
ncbi:MAG: glycosyltransferase family 2 protein [Ferruginibacter sp.]